MTPLRKAVLLAGAAIAAVPVLSGCGAGQNAPTRLEYPVTDGVQAHADNVVLRNVLLTADVAVGVGASSLALQGVVVNNGGSDDQLTSVTASGAGVAFASTAATASQPAAASATTASSAPAAPTRLPATVSPGAPVPLGPSGLSLGVDQLPAKVLPGALVSVTFSFLQAGAVTVQVPVYTAASRSGEASGAPQSYPAPEVPENFNPSPYDNVSSSAGF